MTHASVLIEGDFVDSYLYGGWLLVWDGRGRLAVIETDAIASAVARRAGVPKVAAEACFVDNKRLKATGSGNLMKVRNSRLSSSNGDVVTLDIADLRPRYHVIAPDASVLDLMMTYSQLFISTDDSLVTANIDRTDVTNIRKRLSHRTLLTMPHLGAISVSCAGLGTWLLYNEYRTLSWVDTRTEQIGESESVRHAWTGSTLLSFDERNRVDLFKAVVDKQDHKQAVTAVVEQDIDSELLENFWLQGTRNSSDAAWDEMGPEPRSDGAPDFVTAFGGLLFAVTEERLVALPVANWGSHLQQSWVASDLGTFRGRVLSVVDTEAGFVIEGTSSLTYVASTHTEKVFDREVISLRSYPRSRRHRRAITATADGGLLVTALLEEHPAPLGSRHLFPPRW